MSLNTENVSPPADARPDPRSRHHPQHQNRARADENTRGHGIGQGQNNQHIQQQQQQQLSPILQHHPSHPEHKSYIRHLQLQQGANGVAQEANHFPISPTSPHTQQQRLYLAYNPAPTTGRHPPFHPQQEVRRVASVERGLGQNKPPVSHRMSRMKSFGDRDRERHRIDEMGFPNRRDQQHHHHADRGGFAGHPPAPRVFDGRDMIGHAFPKRIDSADRMAQMNYGIPNGAPRGKLAIDGGGLKKIGLPSTPSPNSSRPGSSRSRRESGSGLKDGHSPGEQETERGASKNGNHNAHRPPPLVKMPLAFNTISRERGFSASSQQPLSPRLPSPRPSNSAPDLAKAETSNRTHHGYGPDAYYAQRRRDHYNNSSQPPSAHQSPHTSYLPDGQPVVDRDSTVSSAASSNAMTVDEAIGMYGSDSDQDDGYYDDTAAVEEQISRFHSENIGNEEINGPVSPFPLQLPQFRDNVRSPSPQFRDNIRSPSPTGNFPRDPRQALPSPPRISEVLANDVVLSPVEEGSVKDEPNEPTPPPPTTQQDPPPTPPQSPPAVPMPINPLEHCVQPCAMPAYISKEVPPRLPYVSNGIGDPVKDARDRYGFRKQTQYVTLEEYEAWSTGYEETLNRRKKKWEQLMKEMGLACTGDEAPVRFPPPSAKIKRYVRKGIPPEWRGNAWFWYAGGQARLSKNPGLYQRLLKEHSSSPDWEIIERDLHRTFPDNIFFKLDTSTTPSNTHQKKPSKIPETPILQALRRVLVAFSIYVPKVGYCQSLNFVAGMLLLFMDEEKAFWMLYIITHQHLPGTHEVNLEGSTADQGVFMMSVRESLPGVWSKIAGGLDGNMDANPKDLPPVTLCTTAWFMSGYIGSLPVESVLRVWDSWFYEGSKTLFRIALTILKLGENEIKTVNDPMEVFQVVQNIPRKLIDAGALLEACFRRRNGFGHLSQQDVDERRKERRAAYASERARALNPGLRQSKDDAGLRMDFGGHDHDFFKMGGKFTRRMKLKV